MLTNLSALTTADIVDLLEQSGYGGDDIFEVEYTGCTNGNVRYKIKYENVDGDIETGTIYISINENAKLTAEY